MTFHSFDICIIQNCIKPQYVYLNGTYCMFLHKEGNNYIVICPNDIMMRSFKIKNNNIILDKNKNIEFIPGGNSKKVETRSISIPINIKERIINCKKYITLNEDIVIFYDVDNNLQIGSKSMKFGNIANESWNNNNVINLKNMKNNFINLVKNSILNSILNNI